MPPQVFRHRLYIITLRVLTDVLPLYNGIEFVALWMYIFEIIRRRRDNTLANHMPFQEPVRYSLLDLCPITEGSTAAQSFKNTLDLARHAEQWGYERYWVAEHHAMPGIASAATAVVIGYIAAGTSTIPVGAGGVMLPNHAPLIIAEQFGTLESIYPGRIELGLGRAPGTDQQTMRALRRDGRRAGDNFTENLMELISYFDPASPGQVVRAVPGEGLKVPIWLLGSSDFSARLAAELGLPFAFASHFAPDFLFHAIQLYRENFKPSDTLEKPYAAIGVNVFAANTDADGYRLSTSLQQQFLSLVRSKPDKLPPSVDTMDEIASPVERAHIDSMMRCTAAGSPETVRRQLLALQESTGADEMIITAQIFDHAARLRSFEIAAEVMKQLTSV